MWNQVGDVKMFLFLSSEWSTFDHLVPYYPKWGIHIMESLRVCSTHCKSDSLSGVITSCVACIWFNWYCCRLNGDFILLIVSWTLCIWMSRIVIGFVVPQHDFSLPKELMASLRGFINCIRCKVIILVCIRSFVAQACSPLKTLIAFSCIL